MEEIKVGEYVRTETGYIGKLNKISTYKINNKDKTMYLVNFGNITYAISYNDIVKHSPNLIDLIEVGDYVNGEIVEKIFNPSFLQWGELPYIITAKNKYEPQEIESIVTKEIFNKIKYEV